MDALAPAARLQALAGRDGNAGRIRQRNEARIDRKSVV